MDRLEQVVQIIAEGQVSLQKLIAELALETQRDFDSVAKQFARRRLGSRQIDHRIDTLLCAIRKSNHSRK